MGPGTLTLTNSTGYNFSATNTITGSYSSVYAISSALGVSIGVAITYSASYSHDVPSGEVHRIVYLPYFTVVQVVQQRYYKIDGYSIPDGSPMVSYVNIFTNWYYAWVRIA